MTARQFRNSEETSPERHSFSFALLGVGLLAITGCTSAVLSLAGLG